MLATFLRAFYQGHCNHSLRLKLVQHKMGCDNGAELCISALALADGVTYCKMTEFWRSMLKQHHIILFSFCFRHFEENNSASLGNMHISPLHGP
jgi:hypothetical protein